MNYDSYFKYYAKKSKQKQLNCNAYQYDLFIPILSQVVAK
ncbi:hypothetical protein STAWA0001_0949 [Staphylococcus warneri L37603]|nr:hypothetical protein STAWA0001_0949 [Staphylococcus warneri L37603]